jgi:2-phosphosulfolactate phosphatase
MKSLDVTLTPSDFDALNKRDLSQTVCVVFDILRATTSMTAALANGADAIIPVAEISEAVAVYNGDPSVLLAGERHGLRILKDQTGSVDFHLGNSPREFVAEKVRGKRIAMTTTNGTRALRACGGANRILIGSFLNLSAVAKRLQHLNPENLVLVCAGTFEEAGYEDTLAAGAIAELVWANYASGHLTDSAQMARQIYLASNGDVLKGFEFSRNARRLLSNPDLRDDVPFCAQRDQFDFVAEMKDGQIRVAHR